MKNPNDQKGSRRISKPKNPNKKIIKIKNGFSSQNFIYTKKLWAIFALIIILLVFLLGRLAYLQFVQGNYLSTLAYNQQAINQIISPKRGAIRDSTGKTLAQSSTVDTITINPAKIEQEDKEKVAKAFSDIFGLDYEQTLEKVNSTSQVETIIKKVEQDKVDNLKTWMKDNDISVGINIDEDSKRYYPYNNFLAQVIGACGSDNQGLSGIEVEWDSVLSGTPGKIVSSKSAISQEIPKSEKTYIPAENGSDLTLTIDFYIQTIVEKYLKQVVDSNNIERGGNCIVMNPKTGDILAMATYPDFNLNEPFTPNETLAKTYNSLSATEKTNAIYRMWSNKSVAELYEPGSVFKLITASVALEENITDTDIDGDFNCTGVQNVDGIPIRCWRTEPHGSESLRRALMNSCNPAFIQLGARVGTANLYKYYKAFGFFDKTGIDLPAEAESQFEEESAVTPIVRATYSFGQRFAITPIQMISAVSAIANNGVLMKPRIVKSITNTDTGAVTNIDPEEVRQVISVETAEKVKSMMQSVVEGKGGTGWRGGVTGYSVGGKTGTSEPVAGQEENGYVATFIAISPVEDTQVVLLLNLYKPPVNNHQGGTLAGPVVSQMLSEILPYLGVPSEYDTSSTENLITVPNVRNKTIAEAEKILSEKGLTSKITTNNDKNSTVIVDQVPKPGATLAKDSIIMLYDQDTRVSTTVPDLTGMSKYQTTIALKDANLNVNFEGSGIVISQDPPKGSVVDAGTVVRVTLKQASH